VDRQLDHHDAGAPARWITISPRPGRSTNSSFRRSSFPVEFAASGTTVQQYISSGDWHSLNDYLEKIRQDAGFDFLALKVPREASCCGRPSPAAPWTMPLQPGIVKAALSGKVVAGTRFSRRHDAHGGPLPWGPLAVRRWASSMRRPSSPALCHRGPRLGTAFSRRPVSGCGWRRRHHLPEGLRISTSVRTAAGGRAVGTTAPPDVSGAVLKRGETWRGRAFVVKDWLISEYDPIRDYDGNVVGMLSRRNPENTYTLHPEPRGAFVLRHCHGRFSADHRHQPTT